MHILTSINVYGDVRQLIIKPRWSEDDGKIKNQDDKK